MGTFARLFVASSGAALATALISAPFLTPAAAMLPADGAEATAPASSTAATTAKSAPRDQLAPLGVAAAGREGQVEGVKVPVWSVPVHRNTLLGPPPAIIRRVENAGMQIAFTFDACATRSQPNGFDRPVLRVLQRERVPATVFTSGRWVDVHPAAMKQLVAEPLIEFANHSYQHPHMGRLTSDAIGEEIDRTEAALARYGKQSVAFRPPFGDFNDLVLEVVRDRRLPAVLWDVVSGDPSADATAEAMIRSVVRDTRAGSIIIFHINGRETKTAAALPSIFRKLRARGFQFVHLSTLLARGTQTIEAAAPVAPGSSPGSAPVDEDSEGIMPLSEVVDGVEMAASPGVGAGAVSPPQGQREEAAPPLFPPAK